MVMLTPKQRDILDFIRRYIDAHAIAPTYREIGMEFGINKVTVLVHIRHLENKGLIRRTPYAARGIEMCDEAGDGIPVAGVIEAGKPVFAVEEVEHINLQDFIKTGDGIFALRVSGNSMIDDHISDGDYVLVNRNLPPNRGDVVVALIDNDEATLKRFYPEGKYIRLQPANKQFDPIVVERSRVTVQGAVIGVFRFYS